MDRFIVRKKRPADAQEEEDLTSTKRLPVEDQRQTSEPERPESSTLTCTIQSQCLGQQAVHNSHDIGNYLKNIIRSNDHGKYQILTKHWKPVRGYTFPTSSHMKRGREEQRRVNIGHFDKYEWLVFSEVDEGLYCKYCAVFCHSKQVGGQNSVPVKKLVSEPLKKYAKLSGKDGDLEYHASTDYHKKSEIDAKNFVAIFENPNLEIINVLDDTRKKQVMENRSRLIPIVKTIILHGRQNIPLRGHRDDGSLVENKDDLGQNEGNFRALLKFRVDSGDNLLAEHLKSAGANATYISKTTANELITCCGEEVLDTIKQRVSDAKYYSVMFDETTDAAHVSQLSLSLRYLYQNTLREDFVGFIDLHETNYSECGVDVEPVISGEVLGKSVLNCMQELELNLKNCVGIGCDGCSVNMSDMRGAVAEIQKVATNSALCACKNHALNLSISKGNKVQSVRNAVGIVKEVTNFFNASAKRNFILKKVLGHQMQGYCETRWVERHESILEFTKDIPKIAEALEAVSKWRDSSTSSKANTLLCSISTCEFIITMHCLSDTSDITCALSKYLQLETVEMNSAKTKITQIIKTFEFKRKQTNTFFPLIFGSAEQIMEKMDVKIRIPRQVEKQINRPNYLQITNESDPRKQIMKYWEMSVYLPILDNLITDLKSRFSEESVNCYQLNVLIPANLDKISDFKSAFELIFEKYYRLFSLDTNVMLMKIVNEICSLKNLSNYNNLKNIENVVEFYDELDGNCYPILKGLTQIC